MKTFLLILITPFFVLAQSVAYPDTVVLKTDKIFPCYVTKLDKQNIEIEYGKRAAHSAAGLASVKRIVVEGRGQVYNAADGFLADVHSLTQFINDREKQREERLIQLKEQQEMEHTNEGVPALTGAVVQSPAKRWSFGVLYVPYYSGKVHYLQIDPYNYRYFLVSTSENRSTFESHLAFLAASKLRLTLDIGYTASYYKNREELHRRDTDNNYTYDNGEFIIDNLKTFIFNIGAKYYLTPLDTKKVSAYFLAGFGRQLAFYSGKREKLFLDENQPPLIEENNLEEFTEDINSPWLLNAGFGVEYVFNPALTLFANIRLYYSASKAVYDFRSVEGSITTTGSREIERSDVTTRIGLGLNFYF